MINVGLTGGIAGGKNLCGSELGSGSRKGVTVFDAGCHRP
jgi:hypothetical protein